MLNFPTATKLTEKTSQVVSSSSYLFQFREINAFQIAFGRISLSKRRHLVFSLFFSVILFLKELRRMCIVKSYKWLFWEWWVWIFYRNWGLFFKRSKYILYNFLFHFSVQWIRHSIQCFQSNIPLFMAIYIIFTSVIIAHIFISLKTSLLLLLRRYNTCIINGELWILMKGRKC